MKVWTDCKICKKNFKEGDHIISLPLWYPDFNIEFGHLKCVQDKVEEDSNKISLKILSKYLYDNNWVINKHSEYLDKAVYLDPQNRFENAEKPFTMYPKSEKQRDYKNRLNQIIQTLSIIMNIPKKKIREELIGREFNAGN